MMPLGSMVEFWPVLLPGAMSEFIALQQQGSIITKDQVKKKEEKTTKDPNLLPGTC